MMKLLRSPPLLPVFLPNVVHQVEYLWMASIQIAIAVQVQAMVFDLEEATCNYSDR